VADPSRGPTAPEQRSIAEPLVRSSDVPSTEAIARIVTALAANRKPEGQRVGRTLPPMPRRCVFCGAPADSQEHVWPNWAALMLADEGPLPHLHQITQEGRPDEERNYSKDAYTVTVGVVCAGCNNGWMSDLESRAKPHLEPMLRGHGRALHESGLRTLATWALKTAMMAEHMHGAQRRAIPREEYAYLFEHGEPSPRIRVWMATYAGARAVAVGGLWGLDAETNETGRREWGA
jgi:hypothetical protein